MSNRIKNWLKAIVFTTVVGLVAKYIVTPAADSYIQSHGGIYASMAGLAGGAAGAATGMTSANANFDQKIARSGLLPDVGVAGGIATGTIARPASAGVCVTSGDSFGKTHPCTDAELNAIYKR